jgi:hypothetical protein
LLNGIFKSDISVLLPADNFDCIFPDPDDKRLAASEEPDAPDRESYFLCMGGTAICFPYDSAVYRGMGVQFSDQEAQGA